MTYAIRGRKGEVTIWWHRKGFRGYERDCVLYDSYAIAQRSLSRIKRGQWAMTAYDFEFDVVPSG